MGDVDILGKVWLKEAATDLARLVLREARLEATSIGSVTLPSIGRTVDGIVRVDRAGATNPSWLHAELQTAWAADVPERTFEYWTIGRREYWPLRSCVIVLTRGDKQGKPRGELDIVVDGHLVCGFRFEVICAWELEPDALLGGPPSLLPLVPFARGSSPEAIQSALSRLSSPPGTADLLAVTTVFAAYAFPTIDWAARIPKEILMHSFLQNATVARLLELAKPDWEAAAKAEGKIEGKVEGKAEGKAEVLIAMLGARLGATFEPLAAAVLRSSDAVLDELTRLVIACPTDDAQLLERLRALLGAPPP